MFVSGSQDICPHLGELRRSFPTQRRRDGSKFYGMFWVTDSARVIDYHPTQPNSMTMEKWKGRKDLMEDLNDRTWPYLGMSAHAKVGLLKTFCGSMNGSRRPK